MNETDRNWNLWARRCARQCVGQGSPSPKSSGSLDTGFAQLHQRTTDSMPSSTANADRRETPPKHDGLARDADQSDYEFPSEDNQSTGNGKLETGSRQQINIGETTQTANSIEPEMTVSMFVRLVNDSGFGEVLTERQLLRQRRAFPSIDAGRGRVNVMVFLASMCSRRRRKSRNGELSVADLSEMLEQQRYRCALTGDRLTPENLALDHIVPISEGGGFDVENSQLVTRDANRAKHTMSQSDFVQLCKNVSQTSGTN